MMRNQELNLIKTPLYLNNPLLYKRIFLTLCRNIRKSHLTDVPGTGSTFRWTLKKGRWVIVVRRFFKGYQFYQSHKAMNTPWAVKDNGVVIVNGKCEDGLGNQDFLRWFEYATIAEMEPYVRASDKVYAQTAYATRCKAARCNILLVSDLPDDQSVRMGLTPYKTLQEALIL
jgi:hypothetical protein